MSQLQHTIAQAASRLHIEIEGLAGCLDTVDDETLSACQEATMQRLAAIEKKAAKIDQYDESLWEVCCRIEEIERHCDEELEGLIYDSANVYESRRLAIARLKNIEKHAKREQGQKADDPKPIDVEEVERKAAEQHQEAMHTMLDEIGIARNGDTSIRRRLDAGIAHIRSITWSEARYTAERDLGHRMVADLGLADLDPDPSRNLRANLADLVQKHDDGRAQRIEDQGVDKPFGILDEMLGSYRIDRSLAQEGLREEHKRIGILQGQNEQDAKAIDKLRETIEANGTELAAAQEKAELLQKELNEFADKTENTLGAIEDDIESLFRDICMATDGEVIDTKTQIKCLREWCVGARPFVFLTDPRSMRYRPETWRGLAAGIFAAHEHVFGKAKHRLEEKNLPEKWKALDEHLRALPSEPVQEATVPTLESEDLKALIRKESLAALQKIVGAMRARDNMFALNRRLRAALKIDAPESESESDD